MNTITERLVGQINGIEDMEIVELGVVSEETKGGMFGSSWDAGYTPTRF